MPNKPVTSIEPYSDDALTAIIARVESSGNIAALRFEPSIYHSMAIDPAQKHLLDEIVGFNNCDANTARVLFSSSFGLYQLMGYNIYAAGYDGTISHFWVDPELQRLYFTYFLRANSINWTWAALKADPSLLYKFASVYNGPGRPISYATAMRTAAQELKL